MTTWTTFFSHITFVIQVLSSLSVLSSVLLKTTYDNWDNFFLAHSFCHTQLLSLLSVLSSIHLSNPIAQPIRSIGVIRVQGKSNQSSKFVASLMTTR